MGLVLGSCFPWWLYWHSPQASQRRWTTGSEACNCFQPPPTALDTAAMTRRKLWASSRARSTRLVINAQGNVGELGTLSLAHHPGCERRHCCRDVFRRMAHCPHHGLEDHEAEAVWRILRGKRRRHHALWHCTSGNSRQHHAHHHGSDRRRGSSSSPFGSALGCREEHCLGVDSDDSRISGGGGSVFWIIRCFYAAA